MNVKGLKQYRSDELNTADARKIVLLLFEGAISFLSLARESAVRDDTAGRAYNINRATAIIFELMQALDLERGGEIACNFRDLYVFLLCRLIEANKGNKPAIIDECIPVLEILHDGWKDAMFTPKVQANTEQLSKTSYSFQI